MKIENPGSNIDQKGYNHVCSAGRKATGEDSRIFDQKTCEPMFDPCGATGF
jgi:hypothetical protein